MRILKDFILTLAVGAAFSILFVFISPRNTSAATDINSGNCPSSGGWGINSGNSGNPGGLVIRTRESNNTDINVTFTLSTVDTNGGNANDGDTDDINIIRNDAGGFNIVEEVRSRTFSTGSTVYCGSKSDTYAGYAVFGFGTKPRPGGSDNHYGNRWTMWCYEDGSPANPEEFKITDLPGTVGGQSGTWSSATSNWDSGFRVTNGDTLWITLTFTPTPVATPTPIPTPTPVPLPTCTLTPQPIEIWLGESSTLSWTTTNATSASLGGRPVDLTGSTGVSPPTTTTYIMTVTNTSGSGDCQTTVFVVEPLSCSLAVDPQLFPAGTTSRLSWTTTGLVKEASIDQGIGQIPETEFAAGSRDITPLTTTTYTMTVKGGNNVQRTNTCFVVAHVLPSCTLSLLPTAIKPGGTALLSWTTVNAASGSIEPQIGDITNQLDAGTRSVSASVDTTFRLTVVNSEGTYFCEVTLHMLPVCNINAQPQAILRGQSFLLSWTTIFTDSASIDNGVGNVSSLLPVGSTRVSPRVDTTYTMTASNQWGDSTCFVVVDIIFSPIISAARGTICDFVVLTIRVLAVSAFVIALFLFIFSGIRWIISRGDERVLSKARSMMLSTGVGLTILVAAVSIILLIEYFFQVTIFTCPS